MEKPALIKTDLIIGMTLAETFLLILFVVWYSHGPGAGQDWKRIAEQRQEQIDKLQAELQAEKENVAELEKIRDWWRKNFRTDPPASLTALEAAVGQGGFTMAKTEGGAKNGGRSNLMPVCSELGLKASLFSAVIQGRDSYEIDGRVLKFKDLSAAYDADLRQASQRCRYLVNVSYQVGVNTEDFVVAYKQLRTTFYVQMQ